MHIGKVAYLCVYIKDTMKPDQQHSVVIVMSARYTLILYGYPKLL